MKRTALSLIVVLVGINTAGAADIPPPAQQENEKPSAFEVGPSFSMSAYFWATALHGKASTLPPFPAVKLDVRFSDLFKNFNGGIMTSSELKFDRWIVMTDLMYSKVTPGGQLPGPYFSEAEIKSQSLTVQGNLMYRVFTNTRSDFDIGAGVRYWNLNNKLTIKPGDINKRVDYSESEYWFDPVIAARFIAHLDDRWSMTFIGDIGGFGAGSRLSYQGLGMLDYKWNNNIKLHAGYRIMSVDYKKGNFLYDVRMQGPMFALTYKF